MESKDDILTFTPAVPLDTAHAPSALSVKGSVPQKRYPFTLMDLYPLIPALTPALAYKQIQSIMKRLERLFKHHLGLCQPVRLPDVYADTQALGLLKALLDVRRFGVGNLELRSNSIDHCSDSLFLLERPRPYLIEQAPFKKILHSLVWIDTNVKLTVERIAREHSVPDYGIRETVEAVLTIYSLILKMENYRLAHGLNFNHSMFLQDRILNLVFGDTLFYGNDNARTNSLARGDLLSNVMALRLLEGLGDLPLFRLCVLSVFMGVVWTSRNDKQAAFEHMPEHALAALETDLHTAEQEFCVNHAEQFLSEVGKDTDSTVIVVLDDNGESVFDLALFQRLLSETGRLKVDFLVNRYPVSNNISLGTLTMLLDFTYFSTLKKMVAEGRVRICIEELMLPSFEEAYLNRHSREILRGASLAYIKGVSFFETFQPHHLPRYYCFTVTGMTSAMLTGCDEGTGVFARVPQGRDGYRYLGRDRIITLRQQIKQMDYV